MALLQVSRGKTLLSRLKPFVAIEHLRCISMDKRGRAWFSSDTGEVEISKWRKVDSRDMGITRSKISPSAWSVLATLRKEGFEAFLVGGCVRDLLLDKVPKDFDVITTAKLKQVKKAFRYAMIIGKRFPICRVSVNYSVVEVSSFETVAEKEKEVHVSKIPMGFDRKDLARWRNSLNRDFTVNSLFFDPFASVIFDYTNAMMDLRSMRLKTVIPAHFSFKQDQARILRGLRLAARLNLSFSKETEAAIYKFSSSVAALDKSRIIMELNYMLSYGAAETSLLMLKKFKLLEVLLPFQAAYLSKQEDNQPGLRSLMLMRLLFNLDQLITCDHPCDDSLWLALLAFHVALFSNAQHVVVVLTFASLLYHGRWAESIKFAKEHASNARFFEPEMLDACDMSDEEIAESVIRLSEIVKDSVDVFTNLECLHGAMSRFHKSQSPGSVFVTQKMGKRVKHVVGIPSKDVESLKAERLSPEISYSLLTSGDVNEIRFVLGKIILSTLVCGERGVKKAENDNKQVNDLPHKSELVPKENHTCKNEKKRRTPPSNYKHLPHRTTKARLSRNNDNNYNNSEDSSTSKGLSRKPLSENSKLHCHNNKKKDEHSVGEAKKFAASLSSIFK